MKLETFKSPGVLVVIHRYFVPRITVKPTGWNPNATRLREEATYRIVIVNRETGKAEDVIKSDSHEECLELIGKYFPECQLQEAAA